MSRAQFEKDLQSYIVEIDYVAYPCYRMDFNYETQEVTGLGDAERTFIQVGSEVHITLIGEYDFYIRKRERLPLPSTGYSYEGVTKHHICKQGGCVEGYLRNQQVGPQHTLVSFVHLEKAKEQHDLKEEWIVPELEDPVQELRKLRGKD